MLEERTEPNPCAEQGARPDADALMVALIMAPGTYSRNRFFQLFEDRTIWRARRRAQMVRSLIKDLTEPWPLPGRLSPHPPAEIVQEEWIEDELHLHYEVEELGYRRSARLTRLEAAALHYCLERAERFVATEQERSLVKACLGRLSPSLDDFNTSSPQDPPEGEALT